MMRIKNGPGHKIYEVGRTLEGELKQNKNNPAYSEKQRQLVTNYISTLQQLSHAYYSNQEQTRIKQIEQETLKTYQELTDWAVSNASSKEESGIVPLAGLGEGVYLASSNPESTFSLTDSTHNPLEQTPYNTYNERRKGNADGRQEAAAGSTAQSIASRSDGEDQQLSENSGVSQRDERGNEVLSGEHDGLRHRGLPVLDGRASNRWHQLLALIARLARPCSLKRAFSILQNVRAANKNGACVDLPYESEGAIRFVISDGSGGATVTVKADGDICALGKEPSCQIKGVAHKLLITAIRHGGIKMDCYGIKLVNLYAAHGFKPVARVPYNAEYADEDMKAYVRDVRNGVAPDVYVLMHDGSTLREAKARGTRQFEQAFRSHTKIPTSKGGDAVRERSEWRDFVWSIVR